MAGVYLQIGASIYRLGDNGATMETAKGWQEKTIMVSDKFRHQLRQEAELWQAEGLIDAEQYQQLSERYQFNKLEPVARDRFITILVGVGSILLDLGVITFVAANWQAWPRGQMPLLAGLMFVPLAYRCRSRAIFALAAILVAISLEFELAASAPFNSSLGWREAIAFALPPALLWAYDDALWPE